MAGFDLREEEEELVGVDPIAKGVEIASKIKAKSNAHTPRAVKNQIGLESLNPDNVTGGAAQSQQDKADGKQPNVKDSFFEAVSFFLPTIIGGAVGSIIGGDEGLVEGAKMGEKAGTGYAKYKQAKQAKAVKQKVDITPEWVDKDTGEPRFTKQVGGMAKFIDENGKVVSAKSVENMSSRDARDREERLKNQSGKSFTNKEIQRATTIVKKFGDKYKDSKKQVMQLDLASTLVKNGALSRDQLATFNAGAIFQEQRKTDEDVARAVTSQSVLNEIFDRPIEALSGKLGPRRKVEAQRVFKIIKSKLTNQVIKSAQEYASPLKVRSSGLSKSELVDEFLAEVGMKRSRKLDSSERRRLEELRNKYR
jgi:hypothetical protein